VPFIKHVGVFGCNVKEQWKLHVIYSQSPQLGKGPSNLFNLWAIIRGENRNSSPVELVEFTLPRRDDLKLGFDNHVQRGRSG